MPVEKLCMNIFTLEAYRVALILKFPATQLRAVCTDFYYFSPKDSPCLPVRTVVTMAYGLARQSFVCSFHFSKLQQRIGITAIRGSTFSHTASFVQKQVYFKTDKDLRTKTVREYTWSKLDEVEARKHDRNK